MYPPKYFPSGYFAPSYWAEGAPQTEGSIYAYIAAWGEASGTLTALAWLTGSSAGSATVTGSLTVDGVSPASYPAMASSGPAKGRKARLVKKALTEEEIERELRKARAEGRLRPLHEIFRSQGSGSGMPPWEEIQQEIAPIKAQPAIIALPKPIAPYVPFNAEISQASKRVASDLMERALAASERAQKTAQTVALNHQHKLISEAKEAHERDLEEEFIELLLMI